MPSPTPSGSLRAMATVTDTTIPLSRRLNVPFVASLATVVAAYVGLLALLRIVIPESEVAGTLAALVFGAGAWLQREFERRIRRPSMTLVSFDGYRIRWWIILILGAIGVWLAESARIWIQLSGGPATAVSASANDALTLLPVGASVVIGLLAGARSDRWPFVVVLSAVVAGHLLALATADQVVALAVGAAPPPTLGPGGPPDLPPNPVSGLFGTGLGATLLTDELPILVIVSLASLWWGARMRLAFYLGHLAGALNDADRSALVDLASHDAERRARAEADADPAMTTTSTPMG